MIKDLRKLASDIGLAGIGVSPAIPEVRKILPWARSVISAAVCYLPSEQEITDITPRGAVARIARSADYHTILNAKFTVLADLIKQNAPTAQIQVCVDTVPIPERKLAVLAGLAGRTRNGNVIVEGCGSYAALGEIVIDIDLPLSAPLEIDFCAGCDLCIKACPAGAIIGPGIIDRAKCISALTQSSGVIPVELRGTMGRQIYGCDACQVVCPRNSNIEPSLDEFAEYMFPGAYPELIPLISLTAKEFRGKVKGSSIGWIGRTKIRRNAAIAAANLKCELAVPALTEMLESGSPVLREIADYAISKIQRK